MKDKVYSGKLDTIMLQTAVNALRSRACYGIVENLIDIDFPLPHRETIDVTKWPKGRIFCKSFELHWEMSNGTYFTIFSADEGVEPPKGLEMAELQLEQNIPAEYYCWNERDPRLSKTLNYRCAPGEGDVKISLLEYRDNHGRLVFWRYTAMQREN